MLRAEEQLGLYITYKTGRVFYGHEQVCFPAITGRQISTAGAAEHLCQYTVQDDRTGRTTLGQCRPVAMMRK